MSKELRSKTVRAIGHLGLGGGVGKLVSLGTTLVMARLLSPTEYGLMALAMVVVGFIGFFNEIGIGSAIVQKADLTQAEVNGCFAVALLASLVLSSATMLGAGAIAAFFGNPQLESMVMVLATTFVIGAFGTVPLAYLRRAMHFKAIAGITVVSIIVQSSVGLALAWRGFGAWSLVWSFVVASVIQSAGALALSGWRPHGRWGIREASSLVMYGLHITNTRVFWYLYTNADKVIIGKLLGERAVGVYDMAFSLATLPSSQVTTLATNVASPLFSKLQHDAARLRGFLLHLTRGVAYLTYPALLGMLACSHELVAVVLGAKWIDVLIPFQALCLMGLVKSVDPLLSQVLISTGHAKKLSSYTLMCGVVITLSVTAGAMLDGLRGVSLVWVVVYPLLSVKLLHDACRITGLRMREYYAALAPVLAGALAMAGVVVLVRMILLQLGFTVPVILAAEIASGAVAYFLWVVYLDARGIAEIRQVMLDLGIAEQKLERWPFNRRVTV